MMKRALKVAASAARGFSLRALVLLIVCLPAAGSAHAQAGKGAKASQELYERVAALDAALFDAYNRCDIDKVGTLFTEDLEFYHEKGGLTESRDATLATMRKNLCAGGGYHLRRELVRGSMEVRPIGDYGAVQTGEHRFYLTQQGRKEMLDGVCNFVMIWRKAGDGWRVSRVISYGCRAPN